MENDFYFDYFEPRFISKNIKCAFHIDRIEKDEGYFFIIEEDGKLILYYALINLNELLKLASKVNYKTRTLNTLELPEFIKKYHELFVKKVVIKDQDYISKTINKMQKDNIWKVKNDCLGADGFSVELKLNKSDKVFFTFDVNDDIRYFYVLDFINYILDEAGINLTYRIQKYN